MMNDSHFWNSLDSLIKSNRIVIDRPKGSVHPKYPDLKYPIDYGYIKGTKSMDGNCIDIWKGTLEKNEIIGIFCTFDLIKKDSEIKIAIDCNDDEIKEISKIYETEYIKGIFIKRNSI